MKRDEYKAIIANYTRENATLRGRISQLESKLAALGESVATDALTVAGYDPDEPWQDEAAVNALVQSQFNWKMALQLLGYPTESLPRQTLSALATKLFYNERVRALLHSTRAGLAKSKEEVVAKLTQDALYGTPENSVRASQTLAKIGGWYKPSKVDVRTQGMTFHALVNAGPDALISALDTFDHEPGAPVKAGVLGAAGSQLPGPAVQPDRVLDSTADDEG